MKNNNIDHYNFDLIDILALLWSRKSIILSVTLFAAVFSVWYAYSLPNIYKSTAMLSPTSSSNSLATKLSSYSSFAGLAGVSLNGGEVSKSDEAIERIKSYNFFYVHFLPNIKLQNLMAVSRWESESNNVIYDDDLFDGQSGKWVRNSSSKKNIPSAQASYLAYKKALNISVNTSNSFVSISIEHKSPYIAKKWVEIIIDKINFSMKEEDKNRAENSIKFLNEISQPINIQSLKDAIANLLEEQMKTLMLTSANKNYVFNTLDYPLVPEKKYKPNRAIVCIMGTIFGFLLSIIIALSLRKKITE